MTLSKDTRLENIEDALLILMKDLHGHAFLTRFIDERSLVPGILSTTWEELKRRYWVRQAGGSRWYYTLSGLGWIEGLKLLDQWDTAELRRDTGKLCAALKARVKDRQFEAMAPVEEIAAESGLSGRFVMDAIESDLIGVLLGRRGAEWLDTGRFIQIPVDFGHDPL